MQGLRADGEIALKITFHIACFFLRLHHSKISYIARYAPDC